MFYHGIQQNVQQWTDLVKRATAKGQLDIFITDIWDNLEALSKRRFPSFLPKTKIVPWWSPELTALRKQVNALKRRVKRCKNTDLKEISKARFKALKNLYRAELIRAKQESWKKFCTESTKHTPWKLYKTCKSGFPRTPVPTSLTLADGSTTTSETETASALHHKFFPDDDTAQDSDHQRNIRTKMAKIEPPNTQPEPHFLKHEVDEVIRNLDGMKCPGPDGIDGVIFKRLHECLPNFWLTLFNKCLSLGCFPKERKKTRVIAISKSDRNKLHSVQGYRDISLLSIPGKCLKKLATERINYFLESVGQTPLQQYGFTAGKSTVDAIKAVSEHASWCRKIGQKCCLLAVDIAGAFDNAWHPGIIARLWKLNCPPNIYSLVRDFLSECTVHVTLGNSVCSKRVTKGCPQGSVSGPTLWNMVINDVIELLSIGPNVKLVVYADDIRIMIQGPSTAAILNTL